LSRRDDVVTRLRAAGCGFAEEEAALLLEAPDPEPLIARRVAGEPLEHVLGWVAFAGRRWAVAPGVFVPRQRSVLMVAEALQAARRPDVTVVDLCCGCGAIGGAVALALRDAGATIALHAADVDPVATACAELNLAPLGGRVHTGDLFAALPPALRGTVDLLLCHAPYVPTAAIATMPPEAREHEPLVALDGGADGLDILRRVIESAAHWLAPGGSLLFEVGDDTQLAAATGLLRAAGLAARAADDEDAGATVVVGTLGR
jgi:release factor glutamine methyltransferase